MDDEDVTELSHVKQAQSCGNEYLLFYISEDLSKITRGTPLAHESLSASNFTKTKSALMATAVSETSTVQGRLGDDKQVRTMQVQ